jgi:hypothetical protein
MYFNTVFKKECNCHKNEPLERSVVCSNRKYGIELQCEDRNTIDTKSSYHANPITNVNRAILGSGGYCGARADSVAETQPPPPHLSSDSKNL